MISGNPKAGLCCSQKSWDGSQTRTWSFVSRMDLEVQEQ